MTSLAAATSLMWRAVPVFLLVCTYFGSRGHLQNPNEWRAAVRWVTAGSGISSSASLATRPPRAIRARTRDFALFLRFQESKIYCWSHSKPLKKLFLVCCGSVPQDFQL